VNCIWKCENFVLWKCLCKFWKIIVRWHVLFREMFYCENLWSCVLKLLQVVFLKFVFWICETLFACVKFLWFVFGKITRVFEMFWRFVENICVVESFVWNYCAMSCADYGNIMRRNALKLCEYEQVLLLKWLHVVFKKVWFVFVKYLHVYLCKFWEIIRCEVLWIVYEKFEKVFLFV